MSRGVLSPD
ncbi:hypothetical protein E2C01_075182 [Portunus trituberculatus]|uniref:Uncharacterized protein n=1 Tax=Portunus trituberculatus TaxID=210409 RepID=A0A5B7IFH7_PORTR|nr:hypothetical protein [Portunus trituberculatus]